MFCLMQDLPIKFAVVAYYSIYVVQVRSPQSIEMLYQLGLGGEKGMLVIKFCWPFPIRGRDYVITFGLG